MDDLFNQLGGEGKHSEEILKSMQAIHILMDGCTENLSLDQLQAIQAEMKGAIKECIFWHKQRNMDRFLYDLRAFGMWLATYVEDCEREFWDAEENS